LAVRTMQGSDWVLSGGNAVILEQHRMGPKPVEAGCSYQGLLAGPDPDRLKG
jgi:hypothetical protein